MPKFIVSEADKFSSARDVAALVRLSEMGGSCRACTPSQLSPVPTLLPLTSSHSHRVLENSTAHPRILGLNVSSNTRSQYSAAHPFMVAYWNGTCTAD